jgi:chemotaxis methyl-accepting protein methylase
MRPAKIIEPCTGSSAGPAPERAFVDAVVDILRSRTGVDFASYRAAMLERRIANHLASSGAGSVAEYLGLLRTMPAEPFRLLERITIKVSRFYRHAPAFDHLRDVVLPALARARGGEPLRIWCAGCGAGEEPYTLAMLMEKAGIDGSIEATDIDASALNEARSGLYPLTSTAELPAALAAEYLEPIVAGGQPVYRVHEDLRARVRFTHHDVTSDVAAPGKGPFDLVSCRNVLIYLQRPAQLSATRRLIDVIREGGVLSLGEAEWPSSDLMDRIEPLSHRTRLFRLRGVSPFIADHELNRARLRSPVRHRS